jgi:CHRD domain
MGQSTKGADVRKLALFASIALLVAASVVGSTAFAGGDDHGKFSAKLSGYREVPPTSTPARGSFSARLDDGVIQFRLTYSDLKAPAGAAHIHFGQSRVNGGVVTFFCGGGSKPGPCPATAGTVTGTIAATDVTSSPEATAQGIAAGEFEELVSAMQNDATYVNVHTGVHPGGEIRGDIHAKGH